MDTFKKKAIALSALPLMLLFAAAFQSSNSVPAQLADIQSEISSLKSEISSLKPRQFYLTQTSHSGAQALSACAAGYHMASLWEIHEPSNLRYNTELGVTQADSGFGPPTREAGWIRTGLFGSAGGSHVGEENCNAWTSAGVSDRGTVVFLEGIWSEATITLNISPWVANRNNCDDDQAVWCVQD